MNLAIDTKYREREREKLLYSIKGGAIDAKKRSGHKGVPMKNFSNRSFED